MRVTQIIGRLLIGIMLTVSIAYADQHYRFDFTSAEGFTDGELANHRDWIGGETGILVDAEKESVFFSPQDQWVSSACSIGLAPLDGRLSTSIDFLFSAQPKHANGHLFSLLANEEIPVAKPALRAALQRYHDHYRIFLEPANSPVVTSPLFPPAALGLHGSERGQSDRLSMTMTLERGATQQNWMISITLSNITQSAEVATLSLATCAVSKELHNAQRLYFGLSSSHDGRACGTTDRQVKSFSIQRTNLTPAHKLIAPDAQDPRPHRPPAQVDPLIDFQQAATVPFLAIPRTLRVLEKSKHALIRDLASLPTLNDSLQIESYGYHSGYLPALKEPPPRPRWTAEFQFASYISLSKIVLVPAIDHRFGRLSSYGFPRRFRILSVTDDGKVNLIKQWIKTDCPNPGRFPLTIDIPSPGVRRVRIEVFRGQVDADREWFALDELFGVMQGTDHLCHKVTVSSEFESLPYWSKDFMIDQKTSLGLPLDVRVSALPKKTENDFITLFDAPPKHKPVLELDMGENRQLGWITLFPAQPPAGLIIPGYGFPGQLTMDIVKESPSGERGECQRVPWSWKNLNPGNNVVHLAGGSLSGRWIRLTIDQLPLHNGSPTFAMGEIHVYNGRTNYDIKSIRLEGMTATESNQAAKMIDGKAGGEPILFLMEWLQKIESRNQLKSVLDEISTRVEILHQRRKHIWQTIGYGASTLLSLMAITIAAIVFAHRHKAVQSLKQRITRDLHDEVGSNLGSISISANHLVQSVKDSDAKEELTDLALMALEACASLREVVWMIDAGTITLPELVKKLGERAARVLNGMRCSIEIGPALPDPTVSLTFKRHLIMLFKEAIHNCARHSHATRARIVFSATDTRMTICICDNGCGFDPTKKSNGWGLESMQDRAKEIGATLTIRSVPEEGTQIELNVPLANISKDPNSTYATSN